MCSLYRALFRAAASMALVLATLPAHATWGAIYEGPDFDSADPPVTFRFMSAGIYDPTTHLIGYINWQDDPSDTIRFYIGEQLGSAGYELRQFRVSFWTYPSLDSGEQGLHLLLRKASALSQPLLSVDVMANSSGDGVFTDNTLRLNSGEVYVLTFSTLGSTNSGAFASYSLGFSITDPVPEPASWALLLPGAAALVLFVRRRERGRQN